MAKLECVGTLYPSSLRDRRKLVDTNTTLVCSPLVRDRRCGKIARANVFAFAIGLDVLDVSRKTRLQCVIHARDKNLIARTRTV